MKLRNLALAGILGLTACTGWEPQKRIDALEAVVAMENSGALTPAQAAALREAIEDLADGISGADVAEWLGAVLVAILGSVLGVRGLRGPAKPMASSDAAVLATLVQAAKNQSSAG